MPTKSDPVAPVLTWGGDDAVIHWDGVDHHVKRGDSPPAGIPASALNPADWSPTKEA